VLRGHMGGLPVVLASATPSLETEINAREGRYRRLHLPERHGGARMPAVECLDLRAHRPGQGRWLAPPLVAALEATLAAEEQAMLFLNRRGYAPLTLCRACGHRFECPNCTAWLVEHRSWARLECHHCGYRGQVPESCPECSETGTLAACGPGVERIAEEVRARLPGARLAVLTSDSLAEIGDFRKLIAEIRERRWDIVIGTQLLAKGHHFPLLTLVGVVDGDLGLAGGDPRAGERSFQMLHQVAGRAGRAERPGRVLIQTHAPGHPVMQALEAGDRDRFMDAEAEQRRRWGLPPFGRLAALILSGPEEAAVDEAAAWLAQAAPRREDMLILGPAPAPLAKLRGRFRRRFLVRATKSAPLQTVIAGWAGAVELPRAIRLQIDIEPYSFL